MQRLQRGKILARWLGFPALLVMMSLVLLAAQSRPVNASVNGSPLPDDLTLVSMTDHTHGWGLTTFNVLQTSNGGKTWRNVSPHHGESQFKGAFLNLSTAWVVGVTEQGQVAVERTIDGGRHWQQSILVSGDKIGAIDMPHFINAYEGWIEVQNNYIMGSGTSTNSIFHTIDGGQHWSLLATSDQIRHDAPPVGLTDTGISFRDAQNLWLTVREGNYNGRTGQPVNTNPIAFVSNDGGTNWQMHSLPRLPGLSDSAIYTTTPPVFFGSYAIMPVTGFDLSNTVSALYISYDGGDHWQVRASNAVNVYNAFVLNPWHIYSVASDGYLYITYDGGMKWIRLGFVGQQTQKIDFVDSNYGWAIVSHGTEAPMLMKTIDGGYHWFRMAYVM